MAGTYDSACHFSPVLIWNAQNDWVSFGFQGGRALAESGLRWDGLIRMIWGQLLYMVPWLALPALYVGVKALAAGPRGQFPSGAEPGVAALFCYIGWPIVIFFTVVALWSDTQFHFHWQAPGYLMLLCSWVHGPPIGTAGPFGRGSSARPLRPSSFSPC